MTLEELYNKITNLLETGYDPSTIIHMNSPESDDIYCIGDIEEGEDTSIVYPPHDRPVILIICPEYEYEENEDERE